MNHWSKHVRLKLVNLKHWGTHKPYQNYKKRQVFNSSKLYFVSFDQVSGTLFLAKPAHQRLAALALGIHFENKKIFNLSSFKITCCNCKCFFVVPHFPLLHRLLALLIRKRKKNLKGFALLRLCGWF